VLVWIGYSCAGPEPFSAIVDGEVRPFVAPPRDCDKNVTLTRWLAPGEPLDVVSRTVTLDRKPHDVAVRYRVTKQYAPSPDTWIGELASPPLHILTVGPY
jgi:hypothetical protein